MTYYFCSYDVCTSDFLWVNILSMRCLSGNGWEAETELGYLKVFYFMSVLVLQSLCMWCVCVSMSHWLLGSSGARFITLLTTGWWRCLKRLSSFCSPFVSLLLLSSSRHISCWLPSLSGSTIPILRETEERETTGHLCFLQSHAIVLLEFIGVMYYYYYCYYSVCFLACLYY